MKRIALIAVVGAAFWALHQSGSPEAATAASLHDSSGIAGHPAAAAGVEIAGTTTAAISGGAGHVRNAVGHTAARIIGPGVAGMTGSHAEAVSALDPALRRASGPRRARATDIRTRIAAADSLALASISEGRPFDAMRHAMRGRGLVDAMRQQLAEEAIR
jgi:hypothetical protein